jgi:hypothetical protein
MSEQSTPFTESYDEALIDDATITADYEAVD